MNIAGSYLRRCNSLYRGIVEENIDPENLGRCKIRVPSIHGELTYPSSILPWARPIVLSPVSSNRGSVNIPDKGSIVWVLFEGSDKNFPIYLGGTYAKGDIGVDINVVDFYIEKDSKISYDREKEEYTIKIGDNKIKISADNIEIVGDLVVKGDLSVEGTTTLNNLIIKGTTNKEEVNNL